MLIRIFIILYTLPYTLGILCVVPTQRCGHCMVLKTGKRESSEKENIVQAVIMALMLMYFFLGISVICDKFMEAIEVMTSSVREVKTRTREGLMVVSKERIWNETVSNLTLMALGSSAPEILLAVIEVCGKDFKSGDLGPGTIVGSAAFNLFFICGLCILVIPKNEVRRIEHLYVFLFTSFSSIFAYVWAYIVSVVISEGEIEVWEALITLLFFPITVVVAYILDIKYCCQNNVAQQYNHIKGKQLNKWNDYTTSDDVMENDDVRKFYINEIKDLRRTHKLCSINLLEDIARFKIHGTSINSRAFYKMEANKLLTGNRTSFKSREDIPEVKPQIPEKSSFIQIIEFEHLTYIAKEDIGTIIIKVIRSGGNMESYVKVWLRTINGSAIGNLDFKSKIEKLHFRPFETELSIPLEIINDDVYEEDEYFTLELFDLEIPQEINDNYKYVLKSPCIATVIIIDDDHPGIFGFSNPNLIIQENVGTSIISIHRMHGARGTVFVPFHTEEGTAKGSGREYMDLEGILKFKDNEFLHNISIKIVDCEEYMKDKYFYVVLEEPYYDPENMEPSGLEHIKPEVGTNKILRVNIQENEEYRDTINRLVNKPTIINEAEVSNWNEQFDGAFSIISNGGDDEGEEELPSYLEYVLHFITLFWKVTFACVPPTKYYSGWITFIVSIIFIGILTMIVGDLATLFGCYVGVLDEVTSLTFVALGTSIPDTFASKVAAMNEPSADSSIGNVTGSNAVNVYLGLGAAWLIGSLINRYRNIKFEVNITTMNFNVSLYFVFSTLAIGLLLLRRHPAIGGELGGKQPYKLMSAMTLFILYIIFVVLCSLRAYCII